ncbi:hypothetical protein THIOKS13500002 [Thiocapsa sp. KS1]|nr:hypothetical protein THIOKS13500002 [Thiocapsa sp. KS1]
MNKEEAISYLRALFLSCLCGSEPEVCGEFRLRDFLSCLCGSEQG